MVTLIQPQQWDGSLQIHGSSEEDYTTAIAFATTVTQKATHVSHTKRRNGQISTRCAQSSKVNQESTHFSTDAVFNLMDRHVFLSELAILEELLSER